MHLTGETKMMKVYLLAAVLAFSACAANADPLPDVLLGRWCGVQSDRDDGIIEYIKAFTKEEWTACLDSDGYLEIKRDRWEGHEESCKFISVKHTGEKTPASTKPTRKDWVPVVRITARCTGEGTTWKKQATFAYGKGAYIRIETER
jgi:hypothetical protein